MAPRHREDRLDRLLDRLAGEHRAFEIGGELSGTGLERPAGPWMAALATWSLSIVGWCRA